MVLSSEPLIIFVPSGLNATDQIISECLVKVLRHSPVFASHIFMVLSIEPLIIFVPSGLYATELTPSEPPFMILRHCPVFASHILTVSSAEPLIIFVPSGLYATEKTPYECPFKVLRHTTLSLFSVIGLSHPTNKAVKTAIKLKIFILFIFNCFFNVSSMKYNSLKIW